MITRKNLKEIIYSLDKNKIIEAINEKGDFILLECLIFNSGFKAKIYSKCYNLEEDNYYGDNGQLYTEKDDFLNLLNEFEIELDF